jgi:hypothetical protein
MDTGGPPKKLKSDPVEDELEGAPLGKETTRAGRTVRRILHELTFQNPRREFRYSRDQTPVRLIQIQELLKYPYEPRPSPEEIEERANSIFLGQCVDVFENNVEWDQLYIGTALKFRFIGFMSTMLESNVY